MMNDDLYAHQAQLHARLSALEQEEQAKAETRRRAQRMAREAGEQFGLEGNQRIKWDDPRLVQRGAWESPEAYARQVRILARREAMPAPPPKPPRDDSAERTASSLEALSPKDPITWVGASAPNDVARTGRDRTEQALADAIAKGGSGRAPSRFGASQSRAGQTPTTDGFRSALTSHDSTQGPHETIEKLKRDVAKLDQKFGTR